MASHKHKAYDDDLLVELIARGDMSCRAIAEQVGLGKQMISRVARGERRPELQSRIQAVVDEYHRRARRLGARSLVNLVARHVRAGLDEKADPEHARKCREFAINKFLDSPKAGTAAQRTLPTPGLTSEDYEAIAKLKGGPPDDEDQQAADQA